MSPSKARNRKGRPSSTRRKRLRAIVAERDGRQCHYCRRPLADDLSDASLDHYVPWCLWRTNQIFNLVLACDPCNSAKNDAMPWPLVWVLLSTYRPAGWEVAA